MGFLSLLSCPGSSVIEIAAQVLTNAVTGKVGPSTQVTGNPTNQELTFCCADSSAAGVMFDLKRQELYTWVAP